MWAASRCLVASGVVAALSGCAEILGIEDLRVAPGDDSGPDGGDGGVPPDAAADGGVDAAADGGPRADAGADASAGDDAGADGGGDDDAGIDGGADDDAGADAGVHCGDGVFVTGEICFPSPLTIAFESGAPVATAMVDVDDDEDLDLVVALAEPSVHLFRNDSGDLVDFWEGSDREVPVSIAVAQVVGGAALDIVVADTSGLVRILEGDGAGQFDDGEDAPSVQTSAPPTSVVAADRDADEDTDLVVGTASGDDSGDVVVFRNEGGSFDAGTALGLAVDVMGVAVADLDQSGLPDIAAATTTGIVRLLDDGAGGFASLQQSDRPANAIAVTDLDGDGNADIVVSETEWTVDLFWGTGGGAFATDGIDDGSPFALADPRTIVPADLDGDEDLDLAVVEYFLSRVVTLINDGGGAGETTFAEGEIVPVSFDTRSLAVGDLDRDGNQDLAAASRPMVVDLGLGGGRFSGPVGLGAGESPAFVVAGDLDGDSDQDLVAADHWRSRITILDNLGDAREFGLPVARDVGSEPVMLALADLDDDDALDIVVAHDVSWDARVCWNGDPWDCESTSPLVMAGRPRGLVVGFLDDDEWPDIIVSDLDDGAGTGSVSVFRGSGDRGFEAPVSFLDGTHPGSLALADLNGDGRSDLVIADEAALAMTILYGRAGDLPDEGAPQTVEIGFPQRSIVAGDLDGDLDADLALIHLGTNEEWTERLACVLENVGDTDLDGRVEIESAGCLSHLIWFGDPSLALADLDVDGLNDLVLSSHAIGTLVYRNTGGLDFTQAARLYTGGWAKTVLVADLDSDGAPDLATATDNDVVVHWSQP